MNSRSKAAGLLACGWCLATVVVVNVYSSTLITHVLAPYNPPAVKNIHDVAEKPDVQAVIDKYSGLDVFLSVLFYMVTLL